MYVSRISLLLFRKIPHFSHSKCYLYNFLQVYVRIYVRKHIIDLFILFSSYMTHSAQVLHEANLCGYKIYILGLIIIISHSVRLTFLLTHNS